VSGWDTVCGKLDWWPSVVRPGLYCCTLYLGPLRLDFWAVHDDFGDLVRVES
jgi:hypothetical protein